MFKPLLLSATLLLASPTLLLLSLAPPVALAPLFKPTPALAPQQQPAGAPGAYVIPPAAAARKNPLTQSTPEGLAQTKKMFGWDCASCHGATGNGHGEVAEAQHLPMGDWTKPGTLDKYTDGELYYMIENGKNQMPSEGPRLNETGYWNMVLYVRSFAKK